MKPYLTIGMATYNDYDGCFFTLQALRMYQECMWQIELLVIDNYGCQATKHLCENIDATYILDKTIQGTAYAKDKVLRQAAGDYVLCLDCHVLLERGVVRSLIDYYHMNPDTKNLIQGPLVYDDLVTISTHFKPIWSSHMWGQWEKDPIIDQPGIVEFEIPMQGLGLFSCKKEHWVGFNPAFKGFGGEEGYLHEKFRQAGAKCLCLSWLRWMHRFAQEGQHIPYRCTVEDQLHNYVVGFKELGLDRTELYQHFLYTDPKLSKEQIENIAGEKIGEIKKPTMQGIPIPGTE